MRCCGIMASDYSAGRYALVERWTWGRWNMLVLFICTKDAVWMLVESHDKSREDIQTLADQKAHWLMQSLSVSYHVSH